MILDPIDDDIKIDNAAEAVADDAPTADDESGGEVVPVAADADGDESGDFVVTIAGEQVAEQQAEGAAPDWVKDLRKNYRELQKEKRALEDRLSSSTQQAQTAKPLSKKPTLADHEYDADAFESALTEWHEKKRQADAEEVKAREAEAAQANAWKAKMDAYGAHKAALKIADYDDAEDVVKNVLSVTQQGLILQGARNPALVVYALGKNEKKAKEFAAIADPVQFAVALGEFQRDVKVEKRKAPPVADKPVSGSGRVSGTIDSQLDRLRADAEKTGNYTKVIAYKKQKRGS